MERPLSVLNASGNSRARRRCSSSADRTAARMKNSPGNPCPYVLGHRVQCSDLETKGQPMTVVSPARSAVADSGPSVIREDAGEIAIVTLNRPEARNSLSQAMLAALGAAFAALAGERKIRVVVLAANGPAFCAGHDLKEL